MLKREEILDEIERSVLSKSVFETSVTAEDNVLDPAELVEQAINKAPNKKHLERLFEVYPAILIEKYSSYSRF